jgi:hypothetical protein
VSEAPHAAFRGLVGAMAMAGVRTFASHAGLIRDDPPSRLADKAGGGLLKAVPRKRRRVVVELVHWAMGATFGAIFGLLPEAWRRRRWSGPLYGFLVWLGFGAGVALLFGLKAQKWPLSRERGIFLADHILYGLVLNEMRSRPRE